MVTAVKASTEVINLLCFGSFHRNTGSSDENAFNNRVVAVLSERGGRHTSTYINRHKDINKNTHRNVYKRATPVDLKL